MKRFMVLVMVLCMVGVANAQMRVPAALDQGVPNVVGSRAGDPYLYQTTFQSGFYMPQGNYGFGGVADELHFNKPITMTGFEFTMVSRVTAMLVPFNATVAFYNMDAGENLLPGALASYSITGLGTGLYTVSQQKLAPVAMPADFYMEVSFADAAGAPIASTGLLLAGSDVPDVGNPSHDFYAMMSLPGGSGTVAGYYWNGGYTPNLPQTDPNYNPVSNYLLAINGIPEPMTLGLVALGGLLVVRRRR